MTPLAQKANEDEGRRQTAIVDEPFTETSTSIAAGARAQPRLVRKYAREGWLSYKTASDGTLLFQPSAADRVRELKAAGLARRGRRAQSAAA